MSYLHFLDALLVGLEILHDELLVVVQFVHEVGQVVRFLHLAYDCLCDCVEGV
jgi:hypothetical protein